MSELRKPHFTFMLKYEAKGKLVRHRMELFNASLFGYKKEGRCRNDKYRIRVDGKWFPAGSKKFFWKSEIRDILFRSISI